MQSRSVRILLIFRDDNINVYYQDLFSIDNVTDYLETAKKCLNLFEQNNNPIIIIENQNPGGMEFLTL